MVSVSRHSYCASIARVYSEVLAGAYGDGLALQILFPQQDKPCANQASSGRPNRIYLAASQDEKKKTIEGTPDAEVLDFHYERRLCPLLLQFPSPSTNICHTLCDKAASILLDMCVRYSY